jgi:hypothetical protein
VALNLSAAIIEKAAARERREERESFVLPGAGKRPFLPEPIHQKQINFVRGIL